MDSTSIENYYSEMEDINTQWLSLTGGEFLITDGIINPELWFPSGKRILFILKEAYSKEKITSWDIPHWLRGEPCYYQKRSTDIGLFKPDGCSSCSECKITSGSYNRLAEWLLACDDEMRDVPFLSDNERCIYWLGLTPNATTAEYEAKRKELLQMAAIVNLKKIGGKSASSGKNIDGEAKNHADLLVRQIQAIQPTHIICAGTISFFDKYLRDKLELGNIPVISSRHPNRANAAKSYEDIRNKYKGLKVDET